MQVTWRASEELVERVRAHARRAGRSMNDYLTQVLDAATNPDFADGEARRLRERLDRAGLLVGDEAPRERPREDAVARARQAAASGSSLSDLVSEGR